MLLCLPAEAAVAEPHQPGGQPGYVRVDTVHQGDHDGAKACPRMSPSGGVYHINMVDDVTQFQFVGSVQAISERFLLPVLEGLIEAFPFVVQGIHADNGSEYVNHRVAALLNKLRIGELTKSRPRHCNDNALAESKNASVVRKHLGHGHIPRHFAPVVNEFTQRVLSPFLNYHRPCLFPTDTLDDKGRVTKRYRDHDVMTPDRESLDPRRTLCRILASSPRHQVSRSLGTCRRHSQCAGTEGRTKGPNRRGGGATLAATLRVPPPPPPPPPPPRAWEPPLTAERGDMVDVPELVSRGRGAAAPRGGFAGAEDAGLRERTPPRRSGRSSRVSARAALLFPIVLLIVGAGMATLAPPAEAQTTVNPTRYCAGPTLLCQIRPDTTRLIASATQQTVTIRRPGFESGFFAQNFFSAKIEACEWTAVTPGQTGTSGTCTTLKDHGVGGVGILNLNFTPTATMISNGGVVITFYWSGLSGVRWANWIPMLAAKAPILSLSPATVAENGGVATVTAEMSSTATSAVTVTVAATAVSPATSSDFTLSTANTLTIAVDGTTVTGVVTVTANANTMDSPNNSVTISGTAASSDTGVNTPISTTLTITDDDAAPDATLALDPASIAENGGISTVTATLSHTSSQPTTVTVAAAAVSPAGAGDFSLSTATTLTVAAGATTSTGTVTVTGVDNDTDAPDKSVEVTATLANGQGTGMASAATLTLTDDDAAPGVTLALNPTSVAENGGVATVSATLSRPSSQPSTVTVTAVSGSYTVGSDATIVIAAGATTAASDTATVAGVDDDVHQGSAGRSATVTGTLANGQGAGAVTGAALTLTDDDAVPTATLVLNPETILETGGVSTVTAKLSHPTTTAAVTLTLTTTAVSPAMQADFTRTGSTLTIAASATTSTGLVTVTAVDNNVATGNKQVRVAATAAGGGGVADPSAATLILRDDEFGLSESAVSGQATEGGGQSTFTVVLRVLPTAAVTVSVSSRDTGEGTVEPSSLTFTTGNWNTAQTVTVTGVQDTIDDGDVTWQVRLDLSSGDADYDAVTDVDVDVTTADDDGPPGVTLTLNPASIAESGTGNVATVTARLSHASGAATTVTVTAVSGFYAAGSDAAIVIPAEATTAASDTATVVAVDNDTDAPDRTETVTATITNARATADSTTMAVTGASLTVRDDEAPPGVTLALDPSSVSENAGISTVTATLSRPSSEPSTVTVTAVSGLYTVGAGAAGTIVIAAGATTAASDTATVAGVDDDVHQGSTGRSVTVTGTLANGQGAGAVTEAVLTLTDDETLPTVTLALPTSVSENGGIAAVSAALSGPSSEAVTVTVATAAVSPGVAGDFTQTGTTLTIAAGAATSTGTVTVTAVDNAVDAADKQVTVSATAVGGNGVASPANATLTLADDETLPMATLILTPSSVPEDGGVSTVTATLSGPSSAAVTLTVATAAVSPAIQTDFTQTGTTLTIAAGGTTSAGTVTVTAVGNILVSGSKRVTVSATAAGGNNVADPVSATLTLRDDEFRLGESAVSGQATEGGGQATFTVVLRMPPTAAVTVSVTSRDTGEGTVEPSSLTFTTGNWNTAQTVTVTGVDDDVDDGTVTWSVRLDPASGDTSYDTLDPVDVVVTTTDDDTAGVEVSPSAGLVTAEGGGREATFTVRLATEPLGDVVLDVASTDTTEGAVDTDAQMNGAQSTLTFTTTNWSSAQTVTVTGVDDALTDGDQGYTVTLAVNQADTADATYDALGTVSVSVVNRDDEGATADVNGDGSIGALDGLLMYYAYTFRTVFELENDLGRRVRGFLRTLRGPTSPPANDAGYKAMLDDAWNWQRADSTAGDVNGDGSIGALDGLLMYYAYTFRTVFELENDLGRRVRAFLRTLRGPGSPPANDAGYKTMLNNAWGL